MGVLLLSACDSSTGVIDSETDHDSEASASLTDAISSERGNELSFSVDFHDDAARLYEQGHTPLFFDGIAETPSDLPGPGSEIEFTGNLDDEGLGSFALASSSTQMLSDVPSSIFDSDFSYSFYEFYRDFDGNTYSWSLDQDLHPHLDDDAPLRYTNARLDLVDALLLDSGGSGGGGDDDCTHCILSDMSDSDLEHHFESQGYTIEMMSAHEVKIARSVGPRSANIEIVTTLNRQTGKVEGSVLKRGGEVESHFSVDSDSQGNPILESGMMTFRPGEGAFDRR